MSSFIAPNSMKQTGERINEWNLGRTCVIVEIKLWQRIYFLFGFLRACFGVFSFFSGSIFRVLLSGAIWRSLLVVCRGATNSIHTRAACRLLIKWPVEYQRERVLIPHSGRRVALYWTCLKSSLRRNSGGTEDPNSKPTSFSDLCWVKCH